MPRSPFASRPRSHSTWLVASLPGAVLASFVCACTDDAATTIPPAADVAETNDAADTSAPDDTGLPLVDDVIVLDAADELDVVESPDIAVDAGPEPRPYPAPDARPANLGPGAPKVTFAPEALYQTCAYLDGGPNDLVDHHNLVVMVDGYLLLPWCPEFGFGGGLTFFDISKPCEPVTVGIGESMLMRETHSVGFYAGIGATKGTGLWAVVNGLELTDPGIEFWDISDPTAPKSIGLMKLPDAFYPDAYARVPLSVFWQGPYVYVAGADNGVYIVDATDPAKPVLAARYQLSPVLRVGQIHAIGNMLIITAAEGPRAVLLDISDPKAPQPIPGGDFEAKDAGGVPRDAYFTNMHGSHLYFARKEDGGGVIIYDIADPSAPLWAGEVTSNGNGGYVFVHEDYAYVGESGFAAIYDVSDLTKITEVARMDLVGDLDTVTPIGNLAILSVDDKAELDKATAIAPSRTAPDDNPPVALWSWPSDGAANIAVSSRFGISMNEMVDVKSAFDGSVRLYETDVAPALGRVDGVFSVQENIVNFWPEAPLKSGTSYTLELPAGGLLDYSGNALAVPFKATFTTAGVAP